MPPKINRRWLSLAFLWAGLGGLTATIVALFVAFGPFMGPMVPVFFTLSILMIGFGQYDRPGLLWTCVAVYAGLGFLFGLSHGYVLYAWPLMLVGGLLWQPSPPNPEPA